MDAFLMMPEQGSLIGMVKNPTSSRRPKKDNNKKEHAHSKMGSYRKQSTLMKKIKRLRQLGRLAAKFQLMVHHTEKQSIGSTIYADWVFNIDHFHCRILQHNRSVNLCGAIFQSSAGRWSSVLPRPERLSALSTDRLLIWWPPSTHSISQRCNSPYKTRILSDSTIVYLELLVALV